MIRRPLRRAVLACLALGTAGAFAVPTNADLETAFQRAQWDEAAQIAWEIVEANPRATAAKVKGAYALFQKGYVNAALSFLKRLHDDEWRQLPQGQDRFVEIVTLFQKKVPVNVLPGRLENTSIEKVSPFLRDEIRFSKGQAALAKGDTGEAKVLLKGVGRNSRFFPQAHYLLGSIATREDEMDKALAEFSLVFEPQVLDQMSEFWRDVSSNVTSHWGASVKVMLDAQHLLKNRIVTELAVLGFARLAYARSDYKTALFHYNRIPADSSYFARANYEKIWALLASDDHKAAAASAAQIAQDDTRFESFEARPARALILVDHGQTKESRAEIENFQVAYEAAKKSIERFLEYKTPEEIPKFIQRDMELDPRVANFRSFDGMINREIAELRKEDQRLFPVFAKLAGELEPLTTLSAKELSKIAQTYSQRRLRDLERLRLQTALILSETYLEDRELLRKQFKSVSSPTEAQVNEHDQELVRLLEKATDTVDVALASSKKKNTPLEFRQAELLWELSTARGILSIGSGKESDKKAADQAKDRALKIAIRISETAPKFSKHGQAMFFAGFVLLEAGRIPEAERQLKDFVAKYPRHVHAQDAYRIIGDLLFDRNDAAGAIAYYRKILEFSDSPIIGYALYKLGWCLYNQNDYPRAMLGLEKAIGWATAGKDNAQALNLTREARRDLIAMYAETGDYKQAFNYFKRVFPDDALNAYIDLGKDLDRMGQYEKSADVWRSIIAMNPSDKRNPEYQTYVLRGVYKLRAWERVSKELHEMVDRYGKWIHDPKPEGDPAFEAEKMSREAVLAQHFEFKQSKDEAEVNRILQLDRDYLSGFGLWPQAQEVQYEYALYLMNRKRYVEALPALRANWTVHGKTMKEPVREESLRNLLFVLEKLTGEEKDPKGATPMAEDLWQFSGDYIAGYPKQKQARTIAAVRAASYFKYGKNAEGIAASNEILTQNASDEAGKLAFQNLRVAYYQDKDWKKVYAWATGLAAKDEMKPFAKELQQIRGETAFLVAEGTVSDDESAKEFLKIADDPGMEFLRDKAIYNAFVRTERAGKKQDALALANRLEKVAPKFEGLKQAAGLRGALYQESGDYERAYPYLVQLLRNPDKGLKPEVLLQARLNVALIAEAVDDRESAEKAFKKIAAEAPEKGNPIGDEARRGIERLSGGPAREVASVPAGWSEAMSLRADFEKQPLPKSKDLAERIQKGAARLENVSKALSAIANAQGVAPLYAFEAYCGLPFVYEAYANGVRKLGDKQPPELVAELEKIVAPIAARGDEFAVDCVKRGLEAEHQGPVFGKALARWGWKKDEAATKRAAQLLALLERGRPWIDGTKSTLNEAQIIAQHMGGTSDDESWYALALRRLARKEPGLARLTLVDALGRKPAKSGRHINTLQVLAEKTTAKPVAMATFDHAAKEGSAAAWVNIALPHLKGDRIEPALTALRAAASAGAFEGREEITTLIGEFPKL